MEKRTIRVTGTGKLKVTPDSTRVTIHATEIYKEYGEAVEASAKATKILKEAVAKAGLPPEDLRTTYFTVDPEYDSYTRDKRKFLGFRYRHNLAIRFPIDNDVLGRLLKALSDSEVDAGFSIGFEVADPEPAKRELLANAVKDSREKAVVLAEAAGVALGDILWMDYSWQEMEIYSRRYENIDMSAGPMLTDSIEMDMDPEDIDLRDTVSILWEIR